MEVLLTALVFYFVGFFTAPDKPVKIECGENNALCEFCELLDASDDIRKLSIKYSICKAKHRNLLESLDAKE